VVMPAASKITVYFVTEKHDFGVQPETWLVTEPLLLPATAPSRHCFFLPQLLPATTPSRHWPRHAPPPYAMRHATLCHAPPLRHAQCDGPICATAPPCAMRRSAMRHRSVMRHSSAMRNAPPLRHAPWDGPRCATAIRHCLFNMP